MIRIKTTHIKGRRFREFNIQKTEGQRKAASNQHGWQNKDKEGG